MMKKILVGLGAAAIVVGAWFSFVRVPPPVPLLSASLEVLAETELQGYCTGEMLIKNQAGKASAAACWEANKANWDDVHDVHSVIPAFCAGIVVNGWNGTEYDCKSIVDKNKLWPIVDGGMAHNWNEAYPYPTERPDEQRISNHKTTTRTGEREENSR